MDQVTQQNAAAAEESNASCLTLSNEIQTLVGLLQQFTYQAAEAGSGHRRSVPQYRAA